MVQAVSECILLYFFFLCKNSIPLHFFFVTLFCILFFTFYLSIHTYPKQIHKKKQMNKKKSKIFVQKQNSKPKFSTL